MCAAVITVAVVLVVAYLLWELWEKDLRSNR